MTIQTRILIILGGLFLALPMPALAVTRNAVWNMEGFWWLDDDASGLNVEDNTGYGAGNTAQETHITGVTKSSRIRLRVDVSETNNQNQSQTLAPRIEYQSGDVTCTAGGTWTTITTSTTNAWALSDSTTITDKDTISVDRVTGNSKAFGTGAGEFLDTSNPGTALTFANKSNEWEYSIIATSNAADSQIYTFRITNNGTALSAYDLPSAGDCPNATTAAAATPTITQNNFLLYVDNNALDPTDIWGNPDIGSAENTPLNALPYTNDPLDVGDNIRIRMNFTVGSATLGAGAEGLILQYAEGSDCTAISSWSDVDAAAGGGTWRYFNNGSITDGTDLSGVLNLSESDIAGRYVESDPTSTNPFSVASGQDMEWDFNVEYNGAAEAHTYCFRARKDDPADLDGYNSDSYPQVDTRPTLANFLRHGNFFTSGIEQGFFWAD